MCADESDLATGASSGNGRIRAATTAVQVELRGQDTFTQGWDGVTREHQVGVVTANHNDIKRRKRVRAGHLTMRGWFANSDLQIDLYPLFQICEAKEFGLAGN